MNQHGLNEPKEKARDEDPAKSNVTRDDLNNLAQLIRTEAFGIKRLIQSVSESLLGKMELIQMNQQELAKALDALTAQSAKIAKEQSDRFDACTAAIKDLTDKLNAGGDVTPEVATALSNVQASMQSLDDAIPDAPATPA